MKILGSVDFLGNPIGLIQDLRDGLKELILEGNVTGMVKNVTHGMSNTAAKVSRDDENLQPGPNFISLLSRKYCLTNFFAKQEWSGSRVTTM